MNTPKPPETRRCVRCWQELPLDAAHFGRRRGGTTFAHTCRECGQKAQRRVVAPIQDGRDWS